MSASPSQAQPGPSSFGPPPFACFTVAGTISGTITGDLEGLPVVQGTVTGTLGGSVLAHVTSLTAQNDGSIELTLTHDFVTEEGALLRTEDTATLSPVQGKEGVFQQETQHTILEGTGRFANATGQLENHGEADLVKGLLTLRYSGTICGVAP